MLSISRSQNKKCSTQKYRKSNYSPCSVTYLKLSLSSTRLTQLTPNQQRSPPQLFNSGRRQSQESLTRRLAHHRPVVVLSHTIYEYFEVLI